MGRKVARPPLGTLYERHFPGVVEGERLRDLLDTAREYGHLLDYQFDADGLRTRRRWIEGLPLDEMFRRIPAADRPRFAAEAFAKLLRQLTSLRAVGLEHGAIHPANVVISRGVRLVDVISNTSRLGASPGGNDRYPVWMWAPTAPRDRGWHRWDVASLMRTCTLLSQGPEAWHTWWTAAEMLEACGQFAVVARRLFATDSEAHHQLQPALKLVRRLVESGEVPERTTEELPPGMDDASATRSTEVPTAETSALSAPVVSAELDPKVDGTPDRAVIEAGAESVAEAVVDSVPEAVVDSVPEAVVDSVPVAVVDSAPVAAPESEALFPDSQSPTEEAVQHAGDPLHDRALLDEVTRTILEGRHYGNWIRRRSIITAQWQLTQRGAPGSAAERCVTGIVAEQGLIDERAFRRKWVPRIDRYLHKNCSTLTFKTRQLEAMIALVTDLGAPRELADRWVRRYLEKGGYKEKGGWFQ